MTTDPEDALAKLQSVVDAKRVQEIRDDGQHPVPGRIV